MTRNLQYFVCGIVIALATVSAALGQEATDPYKELLGYRFDQPRTVLAAIETEIRATKPEQLGTVENKLLEILQSPLATSDVKACVCRLLRQVGSEKSVDAVTPLLADKHLATAARLALQSIPGAKVDAALRDAMTKLQGDLLAGVIQTLGVRGDRQAVPLLAPLAGNANPAIAEAAICALGHIGGVEALRALEQAKLPDRLNASRGHAVLLCAERMVSDGLIAEAAATYQKPFRETTDAAIQMAALRGIVLTDRSTAAPVLLSALKNGPAKLRAAAAKYLCESNDERLRADVLADTPSLPVEGQILILGLLRDASALGTALKAAKSDDPAIRLAAIDALGRVGDASIAELLLEIAAAEKGEPQAAARKSLQEGRGILPALLLAMRQGQRSRRIEAIRAVAARGETQAATDLLTIAVDQDPQLQSEALVALAVLGDQTVLTPVIGILKQAKTDAHRAAAEKAAIEICRRNENKDQAAAVVVAALPGSTSAVRCALLRVAARAASATALSALRSAVHDDDAAATDAAVRGLAQWPDATAASDLLAIAGSAKGQNHRILALRGLIRLAALPDNPPQEAVKLLSDVIEVASRAEEKRSALAALAHINHPAAMAFAVRCLRNQELEIDAATAVLKIAKSIRATDPDAATAAIHKVLDTCKSPAAQQLAGHALVMLGALVNIAPQGIASGPDGLQKDGQAGGDQAAIDGNPETYWDKTDNQKLYRLVVAFKRPEKIAAVSVVGYEHHNFAPKDFEILCDGRVVKKIENAEYDDNFLMIRLDEVACTTVELKITGSYGPSPAIRELGIYRSAAGK